MKIDIKTGVVDFGNGLVIDPRESLEEFDKKVSRELIERVGKVQDMTIYRFKSIYISGINMNIKLVIDFQPGEKLNKINLRKLIPREEMDDNTYFDSRTHEKLREEYRDILANLLKVPSNRACGTYRFPWGIVGAMFDPRTPGSEIEIRYEEETEYEREYSLNKQEQEQLSEELKRYIAAFERHQQNQPGFFDLEGKKLKAAEYAQLLAWDKDRRKRLEANQRRGKELSVMYKTMMAECEKTNSGL